MICVFCAYLRKGSMTHNLKVIVLVSVLASRLLVKASPTTVKGTVLAYLPRINQHVS